MECADVRPEPNLVIERFRRSHPTLGTSPAGASWGYFQLGPLRIISGGTGNKNPQAEGWEHVSVSCIDRTPTWDEMKAVKEMFWGDDETVVQFHPARAAYVSQHPYCLHLWRRPGALLDLPPRGLIA
jgi:hypothetical protein